MTNEEVLSRLSVERGLISQKRTHKLFYFGRIARHDRKQSSHIVQIVEEEGADPDVSGATTSKNGLATSSTLTSNQPRIV